MAIEQRNSPTLRLGGSLIEFSDRPLSIGHTGATYNNGFRKSGLNMTKDVMKQARGGLQVLQELEQLPLGARTDRLYIHD
jgi:hypothetical protein